MTKAIPLQSQRADSKHAAVQDADFYPSPLQQRNVRPGRSRQHANEARIVIHLDHKGIRLKAGPPIERQRVRMIEAAGVQPQPANGARPRRINCEIHHEPARAFADRISDDAEPRNLALLFFAKIQFEQTDARVAVGEDKNLDARIAENRRQIFVGHLESRPPQPMFADRPEQGAISIEIGRSPARYRQRGRAIRSARRRRPLTHLHECDSIDQLPRRYRRIAVWK